MGGKARAEALTEDQRKSIAQKASKARWDLEQAEHNGILPIGDMSFPCSVLSDRTRILTQSDFMAGMGMYYSGWVAKNRPLDQPADLPHFLSFEALKPFIDKHLGDLQSITVKYRTKSGNVAHGIKAEIIPKICEVWMDAEEQGKLGKRQKQIAQKAKILMRALAHVGIIALVDEATGYQDARARRALAEILEQFIAKELRAWASTFPLEFYREIFRLHGWPFDPENMKRPQVIGHYTNNIVYRRLAPGVLKELRDKNPVIEGRRKHKHFQWLSGDIGHPKLLAHLEGAKILMAESTTWDEFMGKLDKYYPIIETTELGFEIELRGK